MFYSRIYQRLLRRGLSEFHESADPPASALAIDFAKFQKTLDAYVAD